MAWNKRLPILSGFTLCLILLKGMVSVSPFLTPPSLCYGADASHSAEAESLLSLGIGFYQKILSPVLASECYMAPSCSRYSRQAFAEYGPLLGLLLTIDRLFHEADEAQTSPLIRDGKSFKLYDPPAGNLWWSGTGSRSSEEEAREAISP